MKADLLKRLTLAWAGALLLALTGQAAGQDDDEPQPAAGNFSLFGSVESDDDRGRPSPISPGDRGRSSEPDFTLVGTSRIGDRYSAILKYRDGQEVLVSSSEGRNSRIEGFPQYSVVDIAPGKVSVQLPGGSPCVAAAASGVSCSGAANIASLELTYAEPVVRRVPETTRRGNPADAEEAQAAAEAAEVDGDNPFAQLRARALAEGDNAPSPSTTPRGSFQPRRIDPADVPPGMRIVSTPFGDRLVEE